MHMECRTFEARVCEFWSSGRPFLSAHVRSDRERVSWFLAIIRTRHNFKNPIREDLQILYRKAHLRITKADAAVASTYDPFSRHDLVVNNRLSPQPFRCPPRQRSKNVKDRMRSL